MTNGFVFCVPQKFTCKIFIDLGKLFDTVDHKIFKNLTHYRIRCTAITDLDWSGLVLAWR